VTVAPRAAAPGGSSPTSPAPSPRTSRLTDLGRDAAGLFDGLIQWAEQQVAKITAARDRYDRRADPEPPGPHP
jgi:DNA-binding HxlR family transcriptional regulator